MKKKLLLCISVFAVLTFSIVFAEQGISVFAFVQGAYIQENGDYKDISESDFADDSVRIVLTKAGARPTPRLRVK